MLAAIPPGETVSCVASRVSRFRSVSPHVPAASFFFLLLSFCLLSVISVDSRQPLRRSHQEYTTYAYCIFQWIVVLFASSTFCLLLSSRNFYFASVFPPPFLLAFRQKSGCNATSQAVREAKIPQLDVNYAALSRPGRFPLRHTRRNDFSRLFPVGCSLPLVLLSVPRSLCPASSHLLVFFLSQRGNISGQRGRPTWVWQLSPRKLVTPTSAQVAPHREEAHAR